MIFLDKPTAVTDQSEETKLYEEFLGVSREKTAIMVIIKTRMPVLIASLFFIATVSTNLILLYSYTISISVITWFTARTVLNSFVTRDRC